MRRSGSCRRVLSRGISLHVRPSSSRPPRFLFTPPHCLKKKATRAVLHWSRMSVTQSNCIGRAPGPDSPPTITQSIPLRFSFGDGPSNGSSDRNFTWVPKLDTRLPLDTLERPEREILRRVHCRGPDVVATRYIASMSMAYSAPAAAAVSRR